MRISDWSSDVCSSDLGRALAQEEGIAMRLLSSLLLVLVAGLASPATAQAPEDGIHRLVLYISEDNEAKMSSALDIAANVSRHYSGIGELVEIEIVAFAGGLQMLRADTSPVKQRMTSSQPHMVNVILQACGHTPTPQDIARG